MSLISVSYTHLDVYKRQLISFGMGEHQTVEIARRLASGEPVESITDVNGRQGIGYSVENLLSICLLYTSRCV